MNKTYSAHNKKQIIIITFNNKHVAVVLIAEGHIAADTYRTYQIMFRISTAHKIFSVLYSGPEDTPKIIAPLPGGIWAPI